MDKHACLIANSQILCKEIDFVRIMFKPMTAMTGNKISTAVFWLYQTENMVDFISQKV